MRQHYSWILCPSPRVKEKRNSLQKKKRNCIISTKHNIYKLNFLMKTFPDKKATIIKVIMDGFFWLFAFCIKQKHKESRQNPLKEVSAHQWSYSLLEVQRLGSSCQWLIFFLWPEPSQLPFYFSNSHEDLHFFQITGNFHILCTKLTNGSSNYTTTVTLKSDSRLRNSIRIGIFNYLAI